jgi:hypothetical protein
MIIALEADSTGVKSAGRLHAVAIASRMSSVILSAARRQAPTRRDVLSRSTQEWSQMPHNMFFGVSNYVSLAIAVVVVVVVIAIWWLRSRRG